MKNKMLRIMGVLATVATIMSLFVAQAMPVSAAAQSWTRILTPANTGQVDDSVLWSGPLERAINGDMYKASGHDDGDLADYDDGVFIYRSTDFGRTWTKTASQPLFKYDTEFEPTMSNLLTNGTGAASGAPVPLSASTAGTINEIKVTGAGTFNVYLEPNVIGLVTSGGTSTPAAAIVGSTQTLWPGDNTVTTSSASGYFTIKLYQFVQPMGLASGVIGQREDPDAKYLVYPVITDIVCSSANANIVYVSDGYDIFKSVDAGGTWVAITNLFITQNAQLGGTPELPIFEQGLNAAGFIVSFDVGYFGGGAYVFAACSGFGNGYGMTYPFYSKGGAYVLQESVYLQPWADMKIGLDRHEALSEYIDVTEIKVMPDFSTTQAVMAVVTDYDFDFEDLQAEFQTEGNTAVLVTTKYGPAQWSQTANDVLLVRASGQDYVPVQSMLLDATLWFPSDFSSNPYGMSMDCLVGINPEFDQGDVYLCYFGPPSVFDEPSIAYDLNIRGADTNTYVSDLDGMGPIASFSAMASGYVDWEVAECMVPNTWTTRNGGVTWSQAAKRPTGGVSPLYGPGSDLYYTPYYGDMGRALSSLRVARDFATSGKALIATHGIDCAVSYTGDFGITCAEGTTVWNGISQINTNATDKHDMFICTDGTIFLSTEATDAASSSAADVLTITAQYHTANTSGSIVADAAQFTATANDVAANLTVLAGSLVSGVTISDVAGAANSSIIWTLGTGLAGSTAVVTLGDTGDYATFTAKDNGTLFTLLPLTVNYTLAMSTDDPGPGSIYDDPPNKVLISGTVLTVRTVLLPNKATTGITVAPAFYDSATIEITSISEEIVVTGADSGNGTYGYYSSFPFHIYLTDTNHTVTITPTDLSSCVEFHQDTSTTMTYSINGGVSITLSGSVEICLDAATDAFLDEYYSLWRLLPGALNTAQDGSQTPAWERVNSWSLYTCPDDIDTAKLVDWDFVRGTADCAAIFVIDEFTHFIYRSVDKGQTWLRQPQYIPFDNPGDVVQSVVAINPTALLIGGENGDVWYSNNLGIWSRRQALPENTWVTDLRLASNGDLLAAGILQVATSSVSAGTIYLSKSVASTTNVGYGTWSNAYNTGKVNTIGAGVLSVTVNNGGSGYTSAPTVTLVNQPTDTTGAGATATATISTTSGRVTGVTVTNPGSGYILPPTVVFGAGNAIATATIEVQAAFIAPSSDYATSGLVNYSGTAISSNATVSNADGDPATSAKYTGGIFQTNMSSLYSQKRLDNDPEWYVAGDFKGDDPDVLTPAGITGLRTAAGGPGFAAEGTGMVYAVPTTTTTSGAGVLRVKGRVATASADTAISRAELIKAETATSSTNLYKLWTSTTDVGNVGLYSFGTDCNIWNYTDTLNKAVTGLKATAVTRSLDCATCPIYGATLTISWDAFTNATHYFVVVDWEKAWDNVYDAAEASEYHTVGTSVPSVDYGKIVTGTTVTITTDWNKAPLTTDTKYNISVWALKYTPITGTYVFESTAEFMEKKFLTSFGMGITVATPPAPVGSLAPAPAAANIPIRPTFQWGAVNGAISYTLQVSTLADFSTLVAPTPVTVTGTAYAWPSTAAPLAYGADYYWRVMATTANGAGPWNTNVFTTVSATPSQLPPVTVNVPTQVLTVLPPPVTVNIPAQVVPTYTLPAIVFPTQPAPIINLPAPIVNIPQAETPIYIWIIVAVGAVLTIAVIVLIIRTRRVV